MTTNHTSSIRLSLLGVLLVCLSTLSLATAQGDEDALHWVAVRWAEQAEIHLQGDRLAGLSDAEIEPIQQILKQALSATWHNAYDISPEQLDAIHAVAQRRSRRTLPRPGQRLDLALSGPADLRQILQELGALPFIEYALAVPEKMPPPQVVPDFVGDQGYLLAAPTGVGAVPFATAYDIRGAGINIVDIEYEFNPNHLDLPAVEEIGGQVFSDFGADHGTAVLGQLGALKNDFGVTGLAPESTLMFHYAVNLAGNWAVGAAVVGSLTRLRPGDIIVIEQQVAGPNYDSGSGSQAGLVPVEWFRPWYEDIVLAVAWGAVVIMAAGNGGENLDDPTYSTGNGGHHPFLPANDSGAIIVGAGAAPAAFGGSDVARSRLSFSNYGSRVNLQGWGQNVATTGYGASYSAQGPNLFFTRFFGGTSAATPIVAGAAALVQSFMSNEASTTLNSIEMRELLIVTGQAQQSGSNPASQRIGPLPDAASAIDLILNTLPDWVYRDRFETEAP